MKFLAAVRDWLLDDLLWKVISLVLAIGIWVTVHRILVGGQSPPTTDEAAVMTEREFDSVPVLVVARAADVHSYKVNPDVVSVTVSGSSKAVNALQANMIRATVDLTDIESARDLTRPVDVSMPPGVTLVEVNPTRVNIISPPASH